jgi:hypothetical protein
MPARPTLAAILQLLARYLRSTSSPTRKRNNTRPRFATKVRLGMEAAGKMALVKPGILPNTEGPRRIPTMTSAMTRGCRSLERGQCRIRQKVMTMPACIHYFEALISECGQAYLYNEDNDGILRVIHGRIATFEDTSLWLRSSRAR